MVEQLKSLSELDIQLVEGKGGAVGQDRVVADGLASTLECLVLTELTRVSRLLTFNHAYNGDNSVLIHAV